MVFEKQARLKATCSRADSVAHCLCLQCHTQSPQLSVPYFSLLPLSCNGPANPHKVQKLKQARALKQITQNISVIISEGTRLTNLINDVLDISKMEAGKLDWHVKENELSVVIEQAVAASSGLFARRPEVTLVEEFGTDLQQHVSFEETDLI